MPSYLAVAIAIALSGSAWQNEVNVTFARLQGFDHIIETR